MRIDAETLIAFADGELDAGRAAEVERAVEADPELRRMLEVQQRLRSRIADRYAPVAKEAVPERLATLVTGAATVSNVVPLVPRARAPRLVEWRPLAAAAATLVLGFVAGHQLQSGGGGPVGLEGTAIVAQGDLAGALDGQLASSQPADAKTRIGVSFAASDGRFCRTFAAERLSGLACRGAAGWELVATAASNGPGGEYRQAGSALINETAQQMMAGEPLDVAGEQRARQAGWRK